MRQVSALLPTLALVFVVACAQLLNPLSAAQEQLDTHRQRWEAVSLIDYRFTFGRTCFCPPEFSPTVTITVKNKVVESVHNAQSGERLTNPPYSHTIDDIFTIIQEAIDVGAAEVSATYDAKLGYPVDVYIDTYANSIDEEYATKVRDFTELPIGPQ